MRIYLDGGIERKNSRHELFPNLIDFFKYICILLNLDTCNYTYGGLQQKFMRSTEKLETHPEKCIVLQFQ
jgi:hypothetical protein